jgi:hypothetical protein
VVHGFGIMQKICPYNRGIMPRRGVFNIKKPYQEIRFLPGICIEI